MDEHFKKAVVAVKTLDGKGATLYAELGAFVQAKGTNGGVTALIEAFKENEALAGAEMDVVMSRNSTYRVVKNLFVNCTKAGICLVDGKGKLKGKTALEKELAATKTPKSPITLFKAHVGSCSKLSDTLNPSDRIMATALVQDLLKEVSAALKLAA